MLPRAHRLTSTLDFSRVVRRGARYASTRVVIHWLETGNPCRVGFVVSKSVGNAPRRNRVRRQLRELSRSWVGVETGDVVIRALSSCSDASWTDLQGDLTGVLERRGVGRA